MTAFVNLPHVDTQGLKDDFKAMNTSTAVDDSILQGVHGLPPRMLRRTSVCHGQLYPGVELLDQCTSALTDDMQADVA